jgi:Xaa-Pro aminopeptidase
LDKTSAEAATSLFQTFRDIGGPKHCAERIEALRHELEKRDLRGFLVPRSDRHQNEYVPPAEERLLWLTGFSGSAGFAIVLRDRAALFVDGRYTIQAAAQIDSAVLDLKHIAQTTPAAWLSKYLKRDDRIGFDPWLHTPETIERFSQACLAAGATLSPVDANPIDAIWSDRPPAPLAPIVIHPIKLAGESSSSKLSRAQDKIASWDGLIVSDPHNAAWLFNIRGHDVAHTPLPLSFAYVPKSGPPTLFVDGRKLSTSARARLSAVCALSEPQGLLSFVEELGRKAGRIALDAATCPAILKHVLEANGGVGVLVPDPITLLKARKNAVELAGTAQAHLRDGAALVGFLEWFDRNAPRGTVTEISAAIELERFRRATGALEDISFPTISAAGPHAAMPHYRVSETSNAMVGRGFFLIDSGGQYRDGTTDITRSICVGAASGEMRDRFTRVLKGHIAVARATFPVGTTGAQLDSFARRALWAAGLDFDHGTGHGVGVYLSVHEGPQRIAKTGAVPLEPGMIVSNEPGYYAVGRFGIRIENLVVVERRKIAGAEREMLGFRTLSLAPIDTRAVNPRLLEPAEKEWLNAYHSRVRQALSPLLDRSTRAWLTKATRKI